METFSIKVKVLDAVLRVGKVHISPNAYLGITSVLKGNTAKYPIRRLIIKSNSISSGSMSRSVDHVFRDVIPQRVVVGIVDNDAFNRAFRKNPFNFKNCKMTLCGLLKNNESIANRPYQTNFPKEGGGEYIAAFESLSTDIAGGCYDHGNAISREDFPNGYTLISFDTSAELCPKAYFDPSDKGGLKLELQVCSALTEAVNIIVYSEFNNLIKIIGTRDVIHNFAE